MTLLAITLLLVAIAAYSISQLQQHGKLKWDNGKGFWSTWSWQYKYKRKDGPGYSRIEAPNNWYYRFFNIDFKERFPLSATLLVFLTDGYHLCQALFFLFLSMSVSVAIGFTWWWFGGIWVLIHGVHWSVYRFLQR